MSFSLSLLSLYCLAQDDRDYVSVRKKFFDLVPRGSIPPQLQTAENLRADLVHKRITLRQHGGGVPPPTPPDVLVALYTNSNLPLPASLRAHVTATPSAGGGSAGHSTSAPSPESGTLLGKRKTTTLAADGGDGGSVGGSIVAPFASAASSGNLSHLANGGGGGGAAGGAYAAAAPSHLTPYAAFVATTTTTAAATGDKAKHEDYAQYLANPAAYRPSPQGAGLTAILFKILHEPLQPAPTTLPPPPHQQKMDSLQAQAAPRSLAALAQRRAQQGGAVLSELGQLEDALLDVFNAHDKLAAYFAARGVAACSAGDAEAADETKAPGDAAEPVDGAELRDIDAVYQQSLGVARAVSQWLETHRPQFKRLKLTPHSLQQMYERRACGSALGGAASAFAASQASAGGAAASQATADAAACASQDESPATATATAKPSSEEDEDGDEAEDDEDADEDGAADDFEDLYASSGHTPRTAGAATAMDAE